MSDFYKKILDNNKLWVETQLALDADFFNDRNSAFSITKIR